MDLECPYCETELDINNDDGFGYEEGIKHEMNCSHCGKSFVFITSISFHFEPDKADCLNDGKHDFKLSHTYPRELSKMVCHMCGKERELTQEEMDKYSIGSIESYMNSLLKPKQNEKD